MGTILTPRGLQNGPKADPTSKSDFGDPPPPSQGPKWESFSTTGLPKGTSGVHLSRSESRRKQRTPKRPFIVPKRTAHIAKVSIIMREKRGFHFSHEPDFGSFWRSFWEALGPQRGHLDAPGAPWGHILEVQKSDEKMTGKRFNRKIRLTLGNPG